MEFSLKELGKRIARRRKQFGLKQNALAERLEISNNHMSCIETGKSQPSLVLLYQICKELKVTPDYFMLGAMRSSNVSQALIEMLELCSAKDLDLLYHIAKYMVQQNCDDWNKKNFV